jgi:hypothetical protein
MQIHQFTKTFFFIIGNTDRNTVILKGDETLGGFMITDNEIGIACYDNVALPCGIIASSLQGNILGKHTVIIEQNKIFFSAQSSGSNKVFSEYDMETGIILFGSPDLTPAICKINQDSSTH